MIRPELEGDSVALLSGFDIISYVDENLYGILLLHFPPKFDTVERGLGKATSIY